MVYFCKSKRSLVGKTAIITGANTGLGYETALEFAKRGCRVIMACRNQQKAEEAKDEIVKATGNEDVIVKSLNLESLSSVRDFARDINNTETRLDLLINNAGAGYLPEKITEDGLQLEMVVNYFAHFLLTMLLLDLMKKSAPSRIINVSSLAAMFAIGLDVDKINDFSGWFLYCRTKLCQIYSTQELAKRLEGTGVTTYSLHPGNVYTDFTRFGGVLNWISSLFGRTVEQGAQTQIYCALEDDIEQYNGEHFDNCQKVAPYWNAKDEATRTKLWEVSEKMVGLSK